MSDNGWEYIDVQELLRQQLPEATTSGNVGAFPVPLGPILSRYPNGNPGGATGLDLPDEYLRALGLTKKR